MLNVPKDIISLQQESSESVKSAISYVLSNYESLDLGKFTIPESEVFGVKLNYTLKSVSEELIYERHRNHIDLHLLLFGSEYISQLIDLNYQFEGNYNAVDDYELIKSSEKNLLCVKAGYALIFERNIWHATGFGYNTDCVDKVVLKIPKDLM